MGEKIARMAPGEPSRRPAALDDDPPIDMDRAGQVLPVFARILGGR